MNLIMLLYVALIAFVLSPGIFISLPPGGSKMVTAGTHAFVIALVYALTQEFVCKNFVMTK